MSLLSWSGFSGSALGTRYSIPVMIRGAPSGDGLGGEGREVLWGCEVLCVEVALDVVSGSWQAQRTRNRRVMILVGGSMSRGMV